MNTIRPMTGPIRGKGHLRTMKLHTPAGGDLTVCQTVVAAEAAGVTKATMRGWVESGRVRSVPVQALDGDVVHLPILEDVQRLVAERVGAEVEAVTATEEPSGE